MSEKFQNKYRIGSHRKPGWKYSSNAMYFVTLVTQHRVCNLGEIVVENLPLVKLSDFGKIVDAEWRKSFEIRNELFLETYIIMPNHLHAIVVINNNDCDSEIVDNEIVDTHGRAYPQYPQYPQYPENPEYPPQPPMPHRLPKSISSFFAGFKSAVNSKIDDYIDAKNLNIPKYNRNNHFFQPNYHDHIIRNDQSFQRISNYIKNNPLKWTYDEFHIL